MCQRHAAALAPIFKLIDGNGSVYPATKSKQIINLSSHMLTQPEISVLDRGLNFAPTPKYICKTPILRAATEFGRKLKLAYFFRKPNLDFHYIAPKFVYKSAWSPKDSSIHPNVLTKIKQMESEINELKVSPEQVNMSPAEYQSLQDLKSNHKIVIKKADKGSAVVVMNRQDYIAEGRRQLSNAKHYKKIDEFVYPKTAEAINEILVKLNLQDHVISDKQLDYLRAADDAQPRRIYFAPKIHKSKDKWINNIPPGRPIVSDINSESYNVSEYIESFLKPLAVNHDSYIKDTTDFLGKLRQTTATPDCLLVTLDVESLYTNINTNAGLKAVRNAFANNPSPLRKDEEILKLLELCLRGGDFEFDGQKYLQISGTAMGKRFAPSLADIYMAEWEKHAIGRCPDKPSFYKRFLDDIFMLWIHGKEKLTRFLEILNSHHPSIKLVATVHEICADFLDLTIFKGLDFTTTGKFDTKVFFKQTDTHALLRKSSFHPKHIFSGILKSQILRFYRICSQKTDFDEACTCIFKVLKQRGYSDRFLRSIKSQTLGELSDNCNRMDESLDPDILNTSNWVDSDEPGSRQCNNTYCVMCREIGLTQTVLSTTTRQEMRIIDRLDCKSKNIIYLIHCDCCKVQYIGETGRRMDQRFMLHRHELVHNKPTSVAFHFNQECSVEHFVPIPIIQCPELETVELTAKFRKRIESDLIKRFKTYAPYGLNKAVKGVTDIPTLPFIAPFSTLAKRAAGIVREAYHQIQAEFPEHFPGRFVAAYSKNKNLKDIVTSSKLRPLNK
jgi:hypothetical protein